MRLKMSPLEALKIIDELVDDGQILMSKFQAVGLSNFNNGLDYYDFEYRDLNTYLEWNNRCVRRLWDIYLDHTPAGMFSYPRSLRLDFFAGNGQFKFIVESYQMRLNVLYNFYEQLQSLASRPLVYIEDKAEIWFNGACVQLKIETNESILCSYIFRFGINEFRDFDEVYAFMFGGHVDDSDQWPKEWYKKVTNAYDGVNQKTNKYLGFPILSKVKNKKIALTIPSSFIKGMY